MPDLSKNLFSVNAVINNNGEVLFRKKNVLILKDDEVILRGYKQKNDLYVIDIMDQTNLEEKVILVKIDKSIQEWHRKSGHMSVLNLKKFYKFVCGLPEDMKKIHEDFKCETYCKAKMVRNPFLSERVKTSKTYDGKCYLIMTCINDTHFCQIYLLSYKSYKIIKLQNALRNT